MELFPAVSLSSGSKVELQFSAAELQYASEAEAWLVAETSRAPHGRVAALQHTPGEAAALQVPVKLECFRPATDEHLVTLEDGLSFTAFHCPVAVFHCLSPPFTAVLLQSRLSSGSALRPCSRHSPVPWLRGRWRTSERQGGEPVAGDRGYDPANLHNPSMCDLPLLCVRVQDKEKKPIGVWEAVRKAVIREEAELDSPRAMPWNILQKGEEITVFNKKWCVPRNSKSGHQLIQNTQAGILSWSPG